MAEKKFETSLKRLEERLEQSLKLFEEGVKLARICNARLEEAERKVEVLLKDKAGKMTAMPFEEKEE
jgi:exodeoxyribonuclease VII small subunit